MEFINQVFAEFVAVLGRALLWSSTLLMLEELTLGGLARLLLSRRLQSRRDRGKK